jgi:hypothetical protein
MPIYNNLEGIRKQSNASLTSIIDVANLNFKAISDANLEFLNNISYDENSNSFSVYKGLFELIELTDTLSVKSDGVVTLSIDSSGKLEGQEILVKVSESKRHRFTDFNDWPDVGVPGEVIYTGVQNQRPEFGEDFIGYLDGRGWVSLTTLNNSIGSLALLVEAGSPLVLPTVVNGEGLIWIGPPGLETAYDPVDTTVYFSDDAGNHFDILSNFAWEISGNDAIFKPTGKAIIDGAGFQFIDGNEQAGYVLHSDGSGNAYWAPAPSGGTGVSNYAYWETRAFTADVTETISHNLGTDNIIVDFIDTLTNERVEGHVDNYTLNDIDVTLVTTNPSVKVVVLAAGGTPGAGGGGATKAVVTFTPGTIGIANTISHNLGTDDIIVQLWDVDTGEVIIADIDNATSTDVDITFGANPTGDVKAVII